MNTTSPPGRHKLAMSDKKIFLLFTCSITSEAMIEAAKKLFKELEVDKDQMRKNWFENLTGISFKDARTRIELCNDYATEIQLDPHCDIKEKLMTLQIYLEGDPWCGTDLYADPKDPPVTRVPYYKNCGWLVVDKDETWHGLERRVVRSPRKSLIVNYVVGDWRDEDQLV